MEDVVENPSPHPYHPCMTNCDLPLACQRKFTATSNCIECGTWVDALVILGDIAHCPEDTSCSHHDACAREVARCAGDLHRGAPLRSRLLDRLCHLMSPVTAFR